ncbi:MAG: DNA-directed RNA polymerase subunit D [Methanosarcina thermophila]|jgi:DNA-directed RNA polymerase subunit D|nr:DNA-directed RNA polymerase subunit D [Methanosarcina thermophila]ALK05662.1 MAG: DNA-directed RNA polymerase subunit D [Methanosarcina sp. 795]NLU56919.1 DNA-directed RNA polymerase subunit D [Methanosarcina thermophila]GLI15242.1 DNA-directed RNA polymerase subunit D [Methanosarcina thermophila MST-A1]HOA68185.1 DNA-directed RNA polymerase subunit D [Methanosarcina thermophila]HOQ65105.1 DNA-directed RNA polymerase subunit D [Methanosarcina thermophila]
MTMEVDILELSDRSAKFVLSRVSTAFANGIRRAMIADVPTLAIEYVNIYDNTSVLYDEQLALRLSLIPLVTDLEAYVPQAECDVCGGEGCPACEVSLTLSAEGPGVVYSRDLISSDPKIQPADLNIPIVELKKGQKLVLEAIAHMGYGRDSARWQAGIACGYKNVPIINIQNCDACGHCAAECPKGIIQLEESGARVSEEDILKCSLCRLCEQVCDIHAIKIGYDESAFVFTMESDGSYTAKDLALNAANVIKGKAEEILGILNQF